MGTQFPHYYDDATCPTPTSSVDSSSLSFYQIRIGSYQQASTRIENKIVAKNEKEMRAERLHKQSMVIKNEMHPNIFKLKGYPFKSNKPSAHYL